MSKHWGWKAKMCFCLCGCKSASTIHTVCVLMHVYLCVRVYAHTRVSSLILYSEAVYCAHNKAEDKLLWIWQLSDSSTVELEENCLVKVFAEMTSNAWLLTAATKTPIPKKTPKKTMHHGIDKSNGDISTLCSFYPLPLHILMQMFSLQSLTADL